MKNAGIGTWLILLVLVALLVVAGWVGVSGWEQAGSGPGEVSGLGYGAMALGIFFTLALGVGLMALMFYGERRK